jgi:Dolichyl-phosphate-mannose-protein mannosyltransferase
VIGKVKLPSIRPKGDAASKILAALNYVFLGVFFMATIYVGITPSEHKFRLYEAPIPIFVGAAALVIVLAWFVEKASLLHKIRRYYWPLVLFGFGFSIAIQLLIAHALSSYGYTWDSAIVYEQAVNYASKGAIDPNLVSYFAINPNNIALLALLGSLFRVAQGFGVTDFLSVAIALNIGVLILTQLITFLVAKLLYGRLIAAVSLLITFVFISLTMYAHIPYTDTLAILFPISTLYITLRIASARRQSVKIALCALLGAVGVIGYLVKPTAIIALMAVAAVAAIGFLLTNRKKGQHAPWLLATMCIAACLGSFAIVDVLYKKSADQLYVVPFSVTKTGETSKPLVHFMAMGLRTTPYDNNVSYGGYSPEDAEAVSKLLTKSAKENVSKALLKQRLIEYGPVGYLRFLSHKLNWILSDATFYAYGEGSNTGVVFTNQDRPSLLVRSFMYIEGKWYVLFGNVLQVFWLAVLLLIAVQLIIVIMSRGARSSAYVTLPHVMIAGILLFLLLFEGRSRYIFLYVPIFIISALYTLFWFKSSAKS